MCYHKLKMHIYFWIIWNQNQNKNHESFSQGSISAIQPILPLQDAMATIYNTNWLKAYPTNNLEQTSEPSLHIRNVVESKHFGEATFNSFKPQNQLLWSFHIFLYFHFVGESTSFGFSLHCIHIGESVLPHLGDPNDFLFF
jgi:hypothetical protein